RTHHHPAVHRGGLAHAMAARGHGPAAHPAHRDGERSRRHPVDATHRDSAAAPTAGRHGRREDRADGTSGRIPPDAWTEDSSTAARGGPPERRHWLWGELGQSESAVADLRFPNRRRGCADSGMGEGGRPARAADGEELAALYERASSETLYRRFFSYGRGGIRGEVARGYVQRERHPGRKLPASPAGLFGTQRSGLLALPG